MEIILSNNIKLNLIAAQNTGTGAFPVIFLHGFSGSVSDWLPFFDKLPERFQPIALDLPGHGMSSSPDNVELYTAESIISQLEETFDRLKLQNIILAGYSMGGRAALSYAAKYPGRLKALILESTTPGIINENDRIERINSDEKLASFIEQSSLEEFVDYWTNLPLFKSQISLTENIKRQIRNSRMNNSQKGLANSLRGFSTGRMPHLWDLLSEVKCRTLLITGSLDEKFTRINKLFCEGLPDARHKIIKEAGHNTHLEKPEVFLNLIIEFFKEIP